VIHTVVKILNERQEEVLYKVVFHSVMQMAADRNILKMKQDRNFDKLGNCVQDEILPEKIFSITHVF